MKKMLSSIIRKHWMMILIIVSVKASANTSPIPLVSGTYDLSRVIKDEVVSGLSLAGGIAKDASIFTIGGLTLDAYILTLPLDADVKARVLGRISNPLYSIPLSHFLYTFKDRYSVTSEVILFNDYIKTHYHPNQYPGMEHSLFSWNKVDSRKDKDDELKFDNTLIATFVTIFDAIFSEDFRLVGDKLPDHYRYLTNSKKDMETINAVQPLIISLLEKLTKTLKPGDIKDAIDLIIQDNASNRKHSINNKAQAITITLIDFIRLNALKNYRQYELEQERIKAFERWMLLAFKESPDKLINFLDAQNNRKHAVQVTVDGLQGEYLKSLVNQTTTPKPQQFLKQVLNDHKHHQRFKPTHSIVSTPEHSPQLNYLEFINQSEEHSPKSVDNEYLPFFKWLYNSHSTSIATGGISSSPTISVRNLPLIWTGAGVAGDGGTGVPNFHFVDRDKDRAYYFFGNDALQLDRLLESNHTQTMFDRLNHLKTLNCNAQYDWNAHINFDGLVNLALGEVSRDFGELRCLNELHIRALVEQQLREDRRQLIKELQTYKALSFWSPFALISKNLFIKERIQDIAKKGEKAMPDYLLVYNPWPDHFAHFAGPFSDEIIAPTGELNRLDYWLGQLKDLYQQAGVYKTTLWGMAGDHGLTPIFYYLNPETEVLKKLVSDTGKKIVIKKISSDEGEGPKITNALNYPSNKGIDVVVASTAGGNFMMDFFKDQESFWAQQPIYEDLLQWKPISFNKSDSGIDIIDEITKRLKETLDYLVVRQSQCNVEQCEIRLISHRQGVRKDEIIHRIGEKIIYFSANNAHLPPGLLDIQETNPYRDKPTKAEHERKHLLLNKCLTQAQRESIETWCTESEWRTLAYYSPRPDAVVQLAHIYDEDRAGTINLFPKEGIGYNTKVPGRHAGEHFHEKDAFVGFWGEPVTTGTQIKAIANGSLAPTLYEYLSGEPAVKGDNGWGFPSIINQLIDQDSQAK